VLNIVYVDMNPFNTYPVLSALIRQTGGKIPLKDAARLVVGCFRHPSDLEACHPGISREICSLLGDEVDKR
jgi:hypothetical protein